jgi:Fic family protein
MRRTHGNIKNMYIYERKGWPAFAWDQERIASLLVLVRHQQGRLIGGMETIGFYSSEEVVLQTLTQDVVKSSEIEGEILDKAFVRSSVARHLGMEAAALNRTDRNVDGVVEMVLDATQKFNRPLTKQRLFNWHASLFPTGRSGFTKIQVGNWRKGDVEVVSGAMGKEVIHFEGPPAGQVNHEMKLFLNWLNQEAKIDLVLKTAIAHLWFVTIHPFDDGNGRIGRAIADLLLARSEKSSRRFYSLSAQIQAERKDYYKILEKTQKDGLNITPWLEWFFQCLTRAIDQALSTLAVVKEKERIWGAFAEIPLNDRQRKLLNRLLDGFGGKLTTSKWAKIAKCSQDTAYRDILDLVDRGILIKDTDRGRSTSYSLAHR